jgi:hypothetical protein
MKKIVLFYVLSCAAFIVRAQTTVTGTVKDVNGNPLHFVFVGNNNEDKVATFTDSLGNFTLKINKAKGLYFSLGGFNDTSVNVGGKNNFQIVLRSGTRASQQGMSALPIIQDNSTNAPVTFGNGGVIAPTHQQGALRGNIYLYDTFVHGFVFNKSGALIHNGGYLFDYDKIGGTLMLTTDNKNVTIVNQDSAKSFTLFDNHDKTLHFAQVPEIDKAHYVVELASGKKYGIYKLITTKFVRADYNNNGINPTGHDYDEYVDNADYYLLDMQSRQVQKISLRKKAIKSAFASDADKVNKFMTDHSSDDINDTYLSSLGDYMNE